MEAHWYPKKFDLALAQKWGRSKGIRFFVAHKREPSTADARSAIDDVARVMGWAYDEACFAAFFAAMKEHATAEKVHNVRASRFWIELTHDGNGRNGPCYDILYQWAIVGDADDEPTADWLKNVIAAAIEMHGMTHDARKLVQNALREMRLQDVCSVYFP
jgi:hypothetical protein